ncbi:hypothetical protein ACSXBA_10815 [Clostridium perfringens]|uniref:Uncharacterized protein n=1 Tax=Clostridium perfringens TaxID=1502 RepID=A0AAW4ISW9_CLOPF|nr:hypothetical protein [Clostridium perfringens]EGT5619381.1 hypothetical protein [Clostridium perfringens]EHK2354926.1 hypothetical protein [Clostridium perfringens]ELC8386661.1 hypothetical protein [Clostridium perfringens]ELC8406206.1 hypothetical protein [Clostridium perfringens]MBO3354383.1 hypothetical protein [Clostridium perfringens]
MDLVKVSKNIVDRVQERFSDLKVDKPLSNLIEEEIKRECIGTDQSNQCTQEINLKDILPPGMDLDNGEIYDIETGETVKEL